MFGQLSIEFRHAILLHHYFFSIQALIVALIWLNHFYLFRILFEYPKALTKVISTFSIVDLEQFAFTVPDR